MLTELARFKAKSGKNTLKEEFKLLDIPLLIGISFATYHYQAKQLCKANTDGFPKTAVSTTSLSVQRAIWV